MSVGGGLRVMIICFKCTQATKQLLDELVGKGAYSDYSELIAAAVNNLAVLETATDGAGSIILNSVSGIQMSESSHEPDPGTEFPETVGAPENPSAGYGDRSRPESVPHIFTVSALVSEPPDGLPEGPFDDVDDLEQVPLDIWVFGQFSKFLPAKAT